MKNGIAALTGAVKRVVLFLKGLGTKRPWVTGVSSFIIVAVVGFAIFGPRSEVGDSTLPSTEPRAIELVPVAQYAEGTVGEGSELVLRAETSGKIVRVLSEGTRVSVGTVVAEFEKASQQASLLQAEGALEAAQAGLEKTRGGLRSEKIAVLEAAHASARSGAVATLLSAYAAVDSAVRDTADQMFSNPESTVPRLSFTSSNSQRRIELENGRVALGAILKRESSASLGISTESDIETELATIEGEVRETRTFIDTLVAALNEAIATGGVTDADIASYKTAATTARTALTTALSSIASSRATLETAKQNLDEGLAGAEVTDLAVAKAAVKQAQGSYDAARAAFEKAIVRAGAPGTVISCNAMVGDVLSVGADVCRLRTAGVASGEAFVLPLSSVKYAPAGSFVFTVSAEGTLEAVPVVTTLVTAHGISVYGLFGDEYVVRDVRGLKAGEVVTIK